MTDGFSNFRSEPFFVRFLLQGLQGHTQQAGFTGNPERFAESVNLLFRLSRYGDGSHYVYPHQINDRD